ncbi:MULTISPECIES: GMC family oxidoreductase [unclassified Pseudofrankia]|uniref:GMC family oxidoreductase n=1 Tax=unclassified Pseudofrankia TaxID=2994372 RepID=UPI000A6E07A7|nr:MULTISPECIES: GMC family oxidoreductase N-terminal domain-containing protein [unclassified Pseudofrankia]MDT3445617.1 GMC family oxidoreductase N-terminal domain-containing protein [Pseudofrankia sp. BMG5.37]
MSRQRRSWSHVIVGGGSAGCVLAARLSEDPSASVLLLEAGGEDYSPFIHLPVGLLKLSKKYNWRYEGEPDQSRGGAVDQWGGGRVLGGSSSINGEMWTRGSPGDYDRWARLGATGWDYRSVLPYFRKSETYTGPGNEYRGCYGPQRVSPTAVVHPLTHAFVAAGEQLGLPYNPDYNGRRANGVSYVQLSQRRGLRYSTARGYLAPVRRRRNLRVRTHAYATGVIVERGVAKAVEYRHRGQIHREHADKSVILSLGAIATPKLLMLSGIGPGADLSSLGIKIAADIPGVGQNLQEHLYTSLMYESTIPTLNSQMGPAAVAKAAWQLVRKGRGPATACIGNAFVFGRFDGSDEPYVDYEIAFNPAALESGGGDGAEDHQHDVNKMRPMRQPAMMALPSVSHPVARGSVTLRSANPDDGPRVRHELLGRDDDVAALRQAARIVRDLIRQPAMAPYAGREIVPGDSVQTDDEWAEFFRVGAFRGEHPSGTCAMGTDAASVVDPELRVHGVENLRVVDASVMPTLIAGHTNAPTIMIAERAADLIRNQR